MRLPPLSRRRVGFAAALASLAFALAGCGGDDVTAPPSQAQAPAGTTATLALLENDRPAHQRAVI